MKLERKHGWWLIVIAVWNVVIWGTFIKNLAASHSSGEDRPAGYYVAHTVLIVVDLLIAVVLFVLGWRRKVLREPTPRKLRSSCRSRRVIQASAAAALPGVARTRLRCSPPPRSP